MSPSLVIISNHFIWVNTHGNILFRGNIWYTPPLLHSFFGAKFFTGVSGFSLDVSALFPALKNRRAASVPCDFMPLFSPRLIAPLRSWPGFWICRYRSLSAVPCSKRTSAVAARPEKAASIAFHVFDILQQLLYFLWQHFYLIYNHSVSGRIHTAQHVAKVQTDALHQHHPVEKALVVATAISGPQPPDAAHS